MDIECGEFLETLPEEFSGLLQALPYPQGILAGFNASRETRESFLGGIVIPCISTQSELYYYRVEGKTILHTFIKNYNSPTEYGRSPGDWAVLILLTINMEEDDILRVGNISTYSRKSKEIKKAIANKMPVLMEERDSMFGIDIRTLIKQLFPEAVFWEESSEPLVDDAITGRFIRSLISNEVFEEAQYEIKIGFHAAMVSFNKRSTIFPGIFFYKISWTDELVGRTDQSSWTAPTRSEPESASVSFLTSDILHLPK